MNAITDAGKEGQVLVGGFDGIREVIDTIKAGKMVGRLRAAAHRHGS